MIGSRGPDEGYQQTSKPARPRHRQGSDLRERAIIALMALMHRAERTDQPLLSAWGPAASRGCRPELYPTLCHRRLDGRCSRWSWGKRSHRAHRSALALHQPSRLQRVDLPVSSVARPHHGLQGPTSDSFPIVLPTTSRGSVFFRRPVGNITPQSATPLWDRTSDTHCIVGYLCTTMDHLQCSLLGHGDTQRANTFM